VLVGTAATQFVGVGVSSFAAHLRNSMVEGSLEVMFAAPVNPKWVIIAPCIWRFTFAALQGIIMILVGLCFGASLHMNTFASVVVLLLAATSYCVIGLVSASVIMVVKRGDPINWFFVQASSLLGGAYFPIELLPGWIAWLPKLLPTTYAFDAVRRTLLTGAGLNEVWPSVCFLAIFSGIGLPIAILVCNWAVEFAKKDGSLGSF